MSTCQPLADGRNRSRDERPLVGSCQVRVLILVDVAKFPAAAAESDKRANRAGRRFMTAAGDLDSLRLSVLRVLTQLCLSCTEGSWAEWAPRFFDSRHGGVGKTPAELRARLRSRHAAQGVRGFRRVTQASFAAFGEACLSMMCGTQGDPLARDRDTALRRWALGQKNPPNRQPRQGVRGGPAEPEAFEDSWEDISRCMYGGHDTSSQEVVVRSLLEVLQEFDEANERDRTVAPSVARATTEGGDNPVLQLLLLHSAFPRTDDDAMQFALRGNFTAEAMAINTAKPDKRMAALDGLLSAHLGKAIVRAGSRGVHFLWQEQGVPGQGSVAPASDCFCYGDDGKGEADQAEGGGSHLHRCLSAAAGSGVLRWDRVVGSTGVLPPSAALGRHFARRTNGRRRYPAEAEAAGESHVPAGRGDGTAAVAVALNRWGDVDVHLAAFAVSSVASSSACSDFSIGDGGQIAGSVVTPSAAAVGAAGGAASLTTPWRLMGTVPIGEIWPSCLAGQAWGATRLLRARCGLGVQLWRRFLAELVAGDVAGVMALPQQLFECDALSNSGFGRQSPPRTQKTLAVSLVVPVSGDCALCFSARGLEPAVSAEQNDSTGPCAADATATAVTAAAQLGLMPQAHELAHFKAFARAGEKGAASGAEPGGLERAKAALERRGAEVGLAMQESSLARKRRRQAKILSGKGSRGVSTSNLCPSATGMAVREGGSASGGPSGSLSRRDSGSLCFTGEGNSGDDGGPSDAARQQQWRLEMPSVTSPGRDSCSPGDCRLFNPEDEDQVSSTCSSSGPRRALYQALEDVSSSRSPVLGGADADSSSTPGRKDGGGWVSAGIVTHGLVGGETTAGRCRGRRGEHVSPAVDETRAAPEDLSGVDQVSAGELPLSLMSEPELACLPGAALPADLVSLAERCARSNETSAAAAADVNVNIAGGGSCHQPYLFSVQEPQQGAAAPQRVGARQRFIDALRSLESARQARVTATPELPTKEACVLAEAVPAAIGHGQEVTAPEDQSAPAHIHVVGGGGSQLANQDVSTEDESARGSGGEACSFEDGVRMGVAGLQMQYREVVEGGQRSPVDFVVHAVPEAIRDMTDGGRDPPDSAGHTTDGDEAGRHARAAQVLSAVVSGLTSTPKELSSKHGANKRAWTSGAGALAPVEASTAAAKPALQKIRDYQLQALLLCQLNSLAMDVPDAPEFRAVFSLLAASESGEARGGAIDGRGKKKKRKGNKKRGRQGGGGTGETGAPTRPCDPLPEGRRTRLVDYLQPISTMLDARTITKTPPSDDGGGSCASGEGEGKAKGCRSRAYDGTLADFMGLALVEHFAARLPHTLGALYEDFEYHPPDALAAAAAPAASTETTMDAGRTKGTGGGVAAGNEAGGRPSEEAEAVIGGGWCAPRPVAAGAVPKTDNAPASSSRGSSTAGILLSDRTPMSHNHFKMSGVLNGFREVKLQGHKSKVGGLRPSVFGRVLSNGQGGRDAGEGGDSGESWGWRTSGGEVEGRRRGFARSRATKDPKHSGGPGTRKKGQQSPTGKPKPPSAGAGTRQPPRLTRKRANGGDPEKEEEEEGGVVVDPAKKHVSGRKRPRPAVSASGSSPAKAASPGGKRRQGADAAPGGGFPRGRAGVLVGETPQKRRDTGRREGVGGSGSGGSGAPSSSRRRGCPGTSPGGADTAVGPAAGGIDSPALPTSPPAAVARTASGKAWKGQIPGCPSLLKMGSPPASPPPAGAALAGPRKRRRATTAAAVVGPASPAEGLFVAESPGLSTGSVRRSGRIGRAASADGDGVFRKLMAEAASPVGRRRAGAVVPDTPC